MKTRALVWLLLAAGAALPVAPRSNLRGLREDEAAAPRAAAEFAGGAADRSTSISRLNTR